MIMTFYAVKDAMTERFMNPALFEREDVAVRQFRSNINNIPLWRDNPQDFDLYSLGTFNDETGELTHEVHKIINGRSAYVKEV